MYTESKNAIKEIRGKYGEIMFRMAISHLMDVGIRHLTEENVHKTCKEIMQQDDSKSPITNEFKCDVVRATYELSKISHVDLLVYIQREVEYDVFDNVVSYSRITHLLKKCIEHIEAFEDYDYEEVRNVLQSLGFDNDEISCFGFEYILDENE